jgi:hypothetical protein
VKLDALSFDTSAINNFFDDPRRDELLALVLPKYNVYISALNLLEIAKTSSATRRENLRAFAKELGRDYEPLELPNHLVRQVCRLFAANLAGVTLRWNVADERRAFWVAMSEANSLQEEERLEAIQWANDLEDGNASSNAGLRAELDARVFGPTAPPRPRKPVELLRIYLNAGWSLKYHIPSQVYKIETGRVLPLSRLDALLEARPSIWPLYLMAYAFSAYYGAVWEKSIGPKNPAGIIDLLYSVYLPACDTFVTHDTRHGGQYDALRLLNAFNSRRPRTRVLNWGQFKDRFEVTVA